MSDPMGSEDARQALVASAQKLTAQAVALDNLSTKADTLRGEFSTLTSAGKATKRRVFLLFAMVIFLVVSLVSLGFVLNQQRVASQDRDALTQRINESVLVQRQNGLCPLYDVLLLFEDPTTAASTTLDRQTADSLKRIYATIHEGYDVLHCADFK